MRKILLAALLLIVGCSNEKEEEVYIEVFENDQFSERDFDYSHYYDNVEEIDVTDNITISSEGTYILSGSANDVVITVNTNDKVQLVLDGLTIKNEIESPIYVENADKVFITLESESNNTLSIDEVSEVDAVIDSKDDLTLNGEGSLEIISAVKGISSNDDLKITGGMYSIVSSGHAVDANNSIRIVNSSFDIVSNKDGLHVEDEEEEAYLYIENSDFNIESATDGISANGYIEIVSGNFNIVTNGGSEEPFDSLDQVGGGGSVEKPVDDSPSAVGIKSDSNITIHDGEFTIDANDDAFNSADVLTIENGNLNIASSDDAIHADNLLVIENGVINITRGYEGLEAINIDIYDGEVNISVTDDGINANGDKTTSSIDIMGGNIFIEIIGDGDGLDSNGDINITGGIVVVESVQSGANYGLDYDNEAFISGGEFIAFGITGNQESNFTSAEQGSMLLSLPSVQTGEVNISLDGESVYTHKTDVEFSSIVISSSSIVAGNTYTIDIGELTGEIELIDNIYGISNNTGPGAPGGQRR